MSQAARWVAAARPGFLVVTLVAAVTGIATSQACGAAWDPLAAWATVVLALLAHAAANLHNDWGDAGIGSDAINTDRIAPFTGGSRVVQDGVFTAAQLRDAVQVLGLLVVAGGVLLAARAGPGLLVIGLLGLALGWAYSHPLWALMSSGAGELAVAASWWLVVVGADLVQRHHFDAIPAVTGVSLALLIAAVLWIAEFPDARSDAAVGKRTLVVRLGAVPAAWGYLALVVFAHAWVAVWWWLQWLPSTAWWALGSAPLSLAAAGWLLVHARAPQRLRPAIVLTLAAVLVHGALMISSLVAVVSLR